MDSSSRLHDGNFTPKRQSRAEGLRRVGSEGEEGQAKSMVLLHCVEDHSLQIDVHKKGGVKTSVVTKMSY